MVIVALGSNLADRAAILRSAVADLQKVDGVTVDRVSSLFESEALKPDGVDPTASRYLNAVAALRSAIPPHALLEALQAIEKTHGRVRRERWGDRTLDLDIITFGDVALHDETLTLPHPLTHTRAFVLVPWLEIDPSAHFPGFGLVSDLVRSIDDVPRWHSAWG